MTSVPFQLWTSRRLVELRPDFAARLSRPKTEHRLEDMIHTVIDVAGLSNPDFIPSRSLFGGNAAKSQSEGGKE